MLCYSEKITIGSIPCLLKAFHPCMVVLLFALMPVLSYAQSSPRVQLFPDKDTLNKLGIPLTIKAGATTLQSVMQSISSQTNLKVEAADYLQGRHLILNITRMSAKDTLDTLADIYEWRWFIPEPGHIFLTRKRPQPPEKISDVPGAIQHLLPRDFRYYVGIDISMDDLPPLTNPDKQKLVQRLHALDPDRMREREERVKGRLATLVQQNTRMLYDSLKSELEMGKAIRYTQLSSEQKTMLKIVLVLGSFQPTNASTFQFFSNNLQPYQLDPRKAELKLENGNTLMIGSTVGNVSTSEGAAIEGLLQNLPTLPDIKSPLPQKP